MKRSTLTDVGTLAELTARPEGVGGNWLTLEARVQSGFWGTYAKTTRLWGLSPLLIC